jgi:hypothetical protein
MKKNVIDRVEPWASFMDRKEFKVFISGLTLFFRKHEIPIFRKDSVLYARIGGESYEQLGLNNLAQTCKLAGKDNYKVHIERHFMMIIKLRRTEKDIRTVIENFEYAKKQLTLKIYDRRFLGMYPGSMLISRKVSTTLEAVVVIDMPDYIMNIGYEMLSKWGRDIDEIYDQADVNSRSKYKYDIEENSEVHTGVLLSVNLHHYTANILLDREILGRYIGEEGLLIGVPNRHAAMMLPLSSEMNLNSLRTLQHINEQFYQMGPGSILNRLLLYDGAKLKEVIVDIGEYEYSIREYRG